MTSQAITGFYVSKHMRWIIKLLVILAAAGGERWMGQGLELIVALVVSDRLFSWAYERKPIRIAIEHIPLI